MAKGLEFKNVFVVGLEEDLFPSQMRLTSRAELEEERRLFYVAITRAEEKLTLTHAMTRYHYGRIKNCEPSRFLLEIDGKYVQRENSWDRKTTTPSTSFVKNLRPIQSRVVRKPSTYKPSADFKPSDTASLGVGMQVEHMKFGFGEVLEIQEYGNDRKARINFADYGEKTLLLSFAKLKIHAN